MHDQLHIRLSEDGADAERLDTMTGHLSQDLRDLDDVEVQRASGPSPENTRAVDAVEVGSLVVTMLTSGALSEVVRAVRRWLGSGGNRDARTVRVELDGDALELTGASSQEQEQLIQLFVLRHLRKPEGA